MTRSRRVLVISDDELSNQIREALDAKGFDVTAAPDLSSAYDQLLGRTFDLVVVDWSSASEAAQFVERLRSTTELNRTPVLTLAEWGTGQATLALAQGADAIEPKPVSAERLLSAVERLLGRAAKQFAGG